MGGQFAPPPRGGVCPRGGNCSLRGQIPTGGRGGGTPQHPPPLMVAPEGGNLAPPPSERGWIPRGGAMTPGRGVGDPAAASAPPRGRKLGGGREGQLHLSREYLPPAGGGELLPIGGEQVAPTGLGGPQEEFLPLIWVLTPGGGVFSLGGGIYTPQGDIYSGGGVVGRIYTPQGGISVGGVRGVVLTPHSGVFTPGGDGICTPQGGYFCPTDKNLFLGGRLYTQGGGGVEFLPLRWLFPPGGGVYTPQGGVAAPQGVFTPLRGCF